MNTYLLVYLIGVVLAILVCALAIYRIVRDDEPLYTSDLGILLFCVITSYAGACLALASFFDDKVIFKRK